MKTDKLVDQLELYSNAIVGFTVAQSVAFSSTFGTSVDFGCEITRYRLLALGLAAHFVAATALAAWAVVYLRRQIVSVSSDHAAILVTVYRAKVVVCVLFAVIPVCLLLAFGVLADPTKGRCSKLYKSSAAVVHHAAAQPFARGDSHREGAWPARRCSPSSVPRAKHLPGACASAQTLSN